MFRFAAKTQVAVVGIVVCLASLSASSARADDGAGEAYSLACFSADVTIPLGHRCMGILPTKSKRIVDPLFAHGFVLQGAGKSIVFVAVDWCEIRNGAYDRWRDTLGKAAGTTRERVLVCSLHQHDAPVTDTGAGRLLAGVGLDGELFDMQFHERAIARVAEAMRESLKQPRAVSQLGIGQARVERVASNRRVQLADGRVSFGRGSRSGASKSLAEAPEGLIDPFVKTLSLWDGDKPVMALSVYAVHPMSYYGQGGVSADFVGMARDRRRRDDAGVHQIYASGCSGDVTAGRYNDGSPANRPLLADRLYQGMKAAWEKTRRYPLKDVAFRNAPLELEFREGERFTAAALEQRLKDKKLPIRDRILAAMSLSSRRRVDAGEKIDMPCLDFGPAQLVLAPGESFVGYQLLAQRLRPDSFVACVGYGECWPGYIPTKAAFDDHFEDVWRWVAPGAEARMESALRAALGVAGQ